jgi:hypothetical protein
VHTDLTLSGSVAQYGRGVGMIQTTAAQIIGQFANNLKAQIARDGATAPASQPQAAGTAPAPTTPPPPAKPISGFSLMAKVLWASIMKLFGRRAS